MDEIEDELDFSLIGNALEDNEDIQEEQEGDPLSRQTQLESWEAGLIEEPEWHKKKEGVFSNALGYFAKNPGRVFKYLSS